VVDPNGPFFKEMDLVLNGTVKAGDVWTLGLRYRNFSYVAGTDPDGAGPLTGALTHEAVARGLLHALSARFKVSVADNPATAEDETVLPSEVMVDGANVHLVIRDAGGFNLRGLPVDGVPRNGLTQEVQSAGDVTRSTVARVQDGTAAIEFSAATVALAGAVAAGETWTVTLGGTPYSYVAGTDPDGAGPLTGALTLNAVALGLRDAIGAAFTANVDANKLSATRAAAFTVAFSVRGVSPEGSAVISGTPLAAQLADIEWLEAVFSLTGPARPGEAWTVTLEGTPYSYVTGSGGDDVTLPAIAAGLADAIPGSYTASADGAVLTVSKADGFTATLAVTASGSAVVDAATATTRTVTLGGPVHDGDEWIIRIDSIDYGYTANAADGLTTAKVAEELAELIDGAGGLTASYEGSAVVITRPAGGALAPAFRVEATAATFPTAPPGVCSPW
jgi:hypothetical protein